MKANELMIGDWVYYRHTEDGIAPYKEVLCIKAEDLCCDACIIEAHYEPIPLTPEILEKNGFVKQGFDGWEIDHKNDDGIMDWMALWRNDYIRPHLLIKSFVSLLGSFSSFGINNVHELQRALRLCKIEKEIEL